MSRKESFCCDSCGTEKGITNHWFLIVPPPRLQAITADGKPVQVVEKIESALLLLPFNVDDAFRTGVEHYCGAACVQKRVAQFLSPQR